MNILLTNDDGLSSRGIQVLAEALQSIAKIWVIAPDSERSGTGHGITVFRPIMLRESKLVSTAQKAWIVDGTPVDCVKLALTRLMPEPPDLVISGINRGANLGTDVLYSGTVSAAVEGVILGVPAVAVSLNSHHDDADFGIAARFTRSVIKRLQLDGIEKDTILNINVPDARWEEIKGLRITRLGRRRYENEFAERRDPRGNLYYWLGGDVIEEDQEPDSDVAAIQDNFISITPIHFDLTDYHLIQQYQEKYREYIDHR